MDELISARDRKKAIFSVTFAPNGRYLAVGSEDCFIDLYDCVSDYDWVGTLQGHSVSVRFVDWSLDSRCIQSTGHNSEILFWDVEQQTQIPSFSATRDIEWDSYTSPIGWPVQGLVGSGLSNEAACRSLSHHLVVSANSDGLVRLFRYPCVISGAEESAGVGHVGTVTGVRFSFDDTYVLSCGGADRTVLQWRVSSDKDVAFDAVDPAALETLAAPDPGANRRKDQSDQARLDRRNARLEDERVPLMDPGKAIPERTEKERAKEAAKGRREEDPLDLEGDKDKDKDNKDREEDKAPDQPGVPEQLPDFDDDIEDVEINVDSDIERERRARYHRGPVAQAVGAQEAAAADGMPLEGQPLFVVKTQAMAVPPTKYKKPDDADDAPLGGLQMEFVYGLRMHDTRDGAQYTGHGHVLFLAGATAVVYSPLQHTQKFFNGHTDDILCVGLHPDCVTAATGQCGRKALLCVWDTLTMQTLAVIRGFHDNGICSVAFSGGGDLLCSVGLDIDHSIAIWRWEKGEKVASATGHTQRIFSVAFNPTDDSLVSVGVQHVKFWKIHGRLLRGKSGTFTQGSKAQAFSSLTVSKKGRVFVGSEQGEIYRWKNGEVDSLVHAHEGPVFALWVCRDGLCSGGKDGKVCVWSLALKPLVDFDMRTQSVGLERTKIRSVCWLVRTILVGTIDDELFEIDIEAGTPTVLLQGHRHGKVSAITCHPSKRIFATGGDDLTVRMWDMDSRKMLVMRTLEAAVCSVAISLDGEQVVVGLQTGKLVVLRLRTLRPLLERKDRKRALLEVKFSANGKFLAAGGEEGFVDLYDVMSDYEWIGTCTGHKGAVTAIDWSSDSKQMQSDDRDGNHLFWDVESTKEILVAAEVPPPPCPPPPPLRALLAARPSAVVPPRVPPRL